MDPDVPELILAVFVIGEIQPMPDSRIMDDLMGSGELERSLSLSGDLWLGIIGLVAMLTRERKVVARCGE